MIQNHCAIEFALDECVRHVRAKMILRQEIPLSSDESHPRGEGQPTEFLVSRVRSWSSEQFNLLNRALQDQNRTGLRTPPPSVKSSRDIRMTSSLKHPKLDKISPMENEIRDSVQEVKQLAKLPRSLSITELSGSDAIPPMP